GYTYGWSQGEKTHKVDHGGKKKEQKADFVRFYRCDYRKSGTFSVASPWHSPTLRQSQLAITPPLASTRHKAQTLNTKH
ncbi:MAG: hypothetical protein IJ613_02520, partial [Muribaculaceae bacterium]|nr:hypothetical protein [Muribaculaceae bacterium]